MSSSSSSSSNGVGGRHHHQSPRHQPSQTSTPALGLENNQLPKRIASLSFTLMSPDEISRVSEFKVVTHKLYEPPTRNPAKWGVMDERLGISSKQAICGTCGHKLAECAGHFGHIDFELPVFHIGFVKHTLHVLHCICKTCSRVLLPPPDRAAFIQGMRHPRMGVQGDAQYFQGLLGKIADKCKKTTTCPYCGAYNGPVRKLANARSIKIVHDKFRGKTKKGGAKEEWKRFEARCKDAIDSNPDLAQYVGRAVEDLDPLRVKRLFEAIPDEDLDLFWAKRDVGRPERFILSKLLVPPVCIRPSVPMQASGGSNEDDLTIKLQEIVQINNALRSAMQKGASTTMIMENWDFLQVQVRFSFLVSPVPSLRWLCWL